MARRAGSADGTVGVEGRAAEDFNLGEASDSAFNFAVASSASVHSFAFIAAAPFFAAPRISRLLPGVVARPPTPNSLRLFQTTPALTPNQYRSATARRSKT